MDALQEYGPVPTDSSDTAAKAAIDVRRFPWIRRLAGAYAHDFESVAPFFAGNPASPDAWKSAIARAQSHPPRRDELARLVQAQLGARRSPDAAREAAARLRDPGTVAIVTGQQAGLFGGPMFTLLKAITTIQLAARVSEEHGVPTTPVFWVDAEDHDWDEVRACPVLDAELKYRAVALPEPPGANEVPVAWIRLDSSIERALDDLALTLAPTEFTESLMEALRLSYRPGVGMAEAFASWMDGLLGARGLVVFDASDPAAKVLSADLFLRELETPGRTASLAIESGRAMSARGHEPQVMPQEDSIALFRLDGARRPIRMRQGRLTIGDNAIDAATLAAEARERPDGFSPNVLLRPLVQDTLFPTACYVAGPSELAYLAQLGHIYEHFGVPMPLVYQRASATILDSASARFLARYDLPLESLQPRGEAGLNRLLESQLPASVESSLHDATAAVQAQLARVIESVRQVDPTLSGAAKTTLGRMEHDLKTLHQKIIQAVKRRDETLRRQFARAQAQAFPDGQPQERALAVVFFINRYGWGLVDRLTEELPLEMGRHWVLTV
jgi:bacillithiol biosynthesis cysteine-adding enzyme BshC